MRKLIFGAMPKAATPSTHIASGPWCFTHLEDFFPEWDGPLQQSMPFQNSLLDTVDANSKTSVTQLNNTSFPLPPDPFPYDASPSDFDSIDSTALAANGEVLRLISLFKKKYNSEYDVTYSSKFWTMALGPWLLLAVHMLAERQKRVEDLIKIYGNENLSVPLLPADCSFSFSSSHEFMQHGVQERNFNHYVFSRIVETMAPSNWKLEILPLDKKNPSSSPHLLYNSKRLPQECSCKAKMIAYLQSRMLHLPFPRQKNFTLFKSLLLSMAVMANRNAKNFSSPFDAYAGVPLSWKFDAVPLIEKMMPTSLCFKHALPAIPNAQKKLKGMTAAISQNDEYRLYLAAWLEGGGRLFSVQHGANYGNLRVMGGSIFEYMQHAFITWGWMHHHGYAVNALPLEQPGLPTPIIRKKTLAQKKPVSLIMIGTEMSPYSYRLKSRPFALAQVEYRKNKIRFLQSLPPTILTQTLYRPYFPGVNGLADESYVKRFFPLLPLCKGHLEEQLLSSRLLILDHYGTTLFTAMAANIPCLCFWNSQQWGMEPEAAKVMKKLKHAGIWSQDPKKTAKKVAHVWDNVEDWWKNKEVQEAREYFIGHYALAMREKKKFWSWFTTLYRL